MHKECLLLLTRLKHLLTGNLAVEEFVKLVEQYLASIPKCDDPQPQDPTTVAQLPFEFPAKPVIESVKVDLVEPVAHVQITFPVQVCSQYSTLQTLCCTVAYC